MTSRNDIEFILSHFDGDIFPRKMMTASSNGQFSVYSEEEIWKRCKQSDFIDCRINAYHEFSCRKEPEMAFYPPNFIFIDLDLANFNKYIEPRKMLDKALQNSLNKISLAFHKEPSLRSQHTLWSPESQTTEIIKEIKPTVLWSGNGYHIYLPIDAAVLDSFEPFSKDKFPYLFSYSIGKYCSYTVSEVFLTFVKEYFTNGKADVQHRPKYKTCLIRIPNTINSKCLAKGLGIEESKVKVIQRWNGYRPPIQLLTKDFRRWLVQEEINQRRLKNKIKNNIGYTQSTNFQINWIEKLLQTGISDGRKETLRLILGPYLAKRKNYKESVSVLDKWLSKCNDKRPLDRNFNSNQRIQAALKNKKGFLNRENLKIKYPGLYDILFRDLNK
jgi:hypothetical protein